MLIGKSLCICLYTTFFKSFTIDELGIHHVRFSHEQAMENHTVACSSATERSRHTEPLVH